MTDADVESLLRRPEIAAINSEAFPANTPLAGILRNDTRIVDVAPGVYEGETLSELFAGESESAATFWVEGVRPGEDRIAADVDPDGSDGPALFVHQDAVRVCVIRLENTKWLVTHGRKYFYRKLKKLGLEYLPSQTNFILINMKTDSQESVRGFDRRLRQMKKDIGLKKVYVLGNKVKSESDKVFISKELGKIKVACMIEFDDKFWEAGKKEGESFTSTKIDSGINRLKIFLKEELG